MRTLLHTSVEKRLARVVNWRELAQIMMGYYHALNEDKRRIVLNYVERKLYSILRNYHRVYSTFNDFENRINGTVFQLCNGNFKWKS